MLIQLFYAFAMTLLTHSLPAEQLQYVSSFSAPAESIDLNTVAGQIESSVQQQMNIPLLDLGALVFYSGNIIVDLFINFFTAVPQMATLLVSAFLMFFNVEAGLAAQLKLFVWVVIAVIYFLNLLIFIMNIRSSGAAVI